jgi:hypothetical protein
VKHCGLLVGAESHRANYYTQRLCALCCEAPQRVVDYQVRRCWRILELWSAVRS